MNLSTTATLVMNQLEARMLEKLKANWKKNELDDMSYQTH